MTSRIPPRFSRATWLACVTLISLLTVPLHAENVKSITQYGITWTFNKAVPSGQFCNGDFWVLGPVDVISISTDLHAPGFTPQPGEDGSMVNPGTTQKQGYDNRLKSYDAKLNASLPGGEPISAKKPLKLPAGSSLVSMVSWLYRSPSDAEPGIPRINGGTNTPRPVTRSGAILTVLAEPAPAGSFRPAYCGTDKSIKFNVSDLDRSQLKDLPAVAGAPQVEDIAKRIQRPWIDHVFEFLGAFIHPSENMPNYGREMAVTLNSAALLLNLDFSKLPGSPSKDDLLISFVQHGIDFTGIADNGGGWPANGGHHAGRKLPIIFAGVLLNDPHMKSVGERDTRFQEDEQTFFVSQADVDMTHSDKWNPDKRGGEPVPYTAEDIGMPEWGIRHATQPEMDNKNWVASYRSINNSYIPGFVLLARLMGVEEAWNHAPMFAYADRVMEGRDFGKSTNDPSAFLVAMWEAYNPKP